MIISKGLCERCGEKPESKSSCWRCLVLLEAPKQEEKRAARVTRSNPERLLNEYGGKELLRTSEGRRVLNAARSKYKKELLQPSDPEFKHEYGKEIKDREEAKRDLAKVSDRMWNELGGRTQHFGNKSDI